jgi:MFS family permease
VLVLVSLSLFGQFYVYDSIGPLADTLQRQLGFTQTQIGLLNAIYSFPNIVMVVIGGVIVDRVGTRLATVAFGCICLLGAILTACTPSFPVMAAGRLLFGIGAESMFVSVTTALGQWFVGRQLSFAFAISLSIGRTASYAADVSPRWAGPLYARGWQPPLWLAAALAGAGLLAAVTYFVVERRAETRWDLQRPAAPERIVWRELWRFDRSYWYVVGLCVTFYSVILPFRSTFAIEYFQHAHALSLQEAGTLNGYVFLAAIFVTPAFGLLVDRVGRRALFMAGGTLVLFGVFPLLGTTHHRLGIATAMLGISFSLVPAVLWPSVPYLVPPSRLGTAYGLMTMVQNVGLTVINLAAGSLNDASHASAANPRGYMPMLWMFGLLSLAGFAFAALLRRREVGAHGHDLEKALPRAKEHRAG